MTSRMVASAVADHRRHPVAVGAPRLRRPRRLPAHLPRAAHRPGGRPVLDLGRPVPALDHARSGRRVRLPAQGDPRQPARRARQSESPPGPWVSCGPGWSTPTVDDLLDHLDEEMTGVQDVVRPGDQRGGDQPSSRPPTRPLGSPRGPAEMRLSIDHQTGFRYATPGRVLLQRGPDDPGRHRAADGLEQPGQHRAGGLELHLHRLLGHDGDHLRAARAARAADRARSGRWWRPAATSWPGTPTAGSRRNDLGWPALRDRGVIDPWPSS